MPGISLNDLSLIRTKYRLPATVDLVQPTVASLDDNKDGGEPEDCQSRGARNSRSRAISQGMVWTVPESSSWARRSIS